MDQFKEMFPLESLLYFHKDASSSSLGPSLSTNFMATQVSNKTSGPQNVIFATTFKMLPSYFENGKECKDASGVLQITGQTQL